MATPFHLPVTAAQVGMYFVGQYYQVLQQQPDFVHQFYSEASTMLRIDGNSRETTTTMLILSGIGNWKLILNSYRDIFEERIEVDLKDKWRNMIRLQLYDLVEHKVQGDGNCQGTFCVASWQGIEVAVKKLGEEVTANEDKMRAFRDELELL
ncbi:hypothetical protein ACSBR1_021090 [Camellia fascicularis]